MDKLRSFFTSKWFFHGLGLLTISILIWFVGPLIAIADSRFLSSVASRLLLILIILVIYAANQVRLLLQAKKKNENLIEEMGNDGGASLEEETNIIQERFQQAITTLKGSSKNKSKKTYLYELPWYIIIGPPGSGKTTALVNSGLEFPLEDKIGLEAVKGIGGTRHCDWWFTSDAVLIDTAGRFTTQDSHSSVDKAAWGSFMDMLKKYRKQRPINGALIAVSLADLAVLSEAERSYYAKTIRKRIEELSQNLRIQFPVYFMFTKCDLIAGFNEFFGGLNEEARAQVWGETFGLLNDGSSDVDITQYAERFDELLNRLRQQVVNKVNSEKDTSSRTQILSFPSQMAALKEPVCRFLQEIFAQNRFQDAPLLRGVYYTSGTQQGTPLDRLLGSMAQNMGMDNDDRVMYSGQGKSFFIRRLLSEVIFPEADIAGVDQKLNRWMRRLQYTGYFVAFTAVIGLSATWLMSYFKNVERIDQVENIVEKRKNIKDRNSLVGAEFRATIQELNLARDATKVFEEETFSDKLGLNQKSTFDPQTNSAYLDVLEKKFLPIIAARLEELMVDIINEGDTSLLYDVLKAYLMYAGLHENAEAEYEPDWLRTIAMADWQNQYYTEPALVADLEGHLDYLLSQRYTPITPDPKIVGAARNALVRLPLSQQLYLNVKQSLSAESRNDLSFRDIAGNFGMDVFKSRSNADVNSITIPGLFTKQGFYQDVITKLNDKIQEYLDSNWVLGDHNARHGDVDVGRLKADIMDLYYQDYIRTWTSFLRDLSIDSSADFQRGGVILEQATSINGPLENIINTVAMETDLSSPLDPGIDTQAISEASATVSSTAQKLSSQANRLARATKKSGLMESPGKEVTDHFLMYHRLVNSERGEPAINRTLNDAREFALVINQTLFESFSETASVDIVKSRLNGTGRDPFLSLRTGSTIMPVEIREWMNDISQLGWTLLVSKAKTEINKKWQREIYPFYSSALAGRYPLDSVANVEIELRDFSNFFRPSGQLDSFLKNYIEPFVRRDSSWTEKIIDGQTLGLAASTLSQLQLASQVTELFFEENRAEPNISFVLTPVSLNANVARFSFNLGGQSLTYAHGPRIGQEMTWPLAPGNDMARLRFELASGNSLSASETGPWSLFKLIDQQKLQKTAQRSVYYIDFAEQDVTVRFELRADTEFNPIGGRILQSLRLPGEL